MQLHTEEGEKEGEGEGGVGRAALTDASANCSEALVGGGDDDDENEWVGWRRSNLRQIAYVAHLYMNNWLHFPHTCIARRTHIVYALLRLRVQNFPAFFNLLASCAHKSSVSVHRAMLHSRRSYLCAILNRSHHAAAPPAQPLLVLASLGQQAETHAIPQRERPWQSLNTWSLPLRVWAAAAQNRTQISNRLPAQS